ncbi:HNH endonuclease [Falsibacillus albus]|uniref:HNH endonuclease n=1 Tax=Falsibacillus albus TaxID=2478915 RepID=A0A3L7K2B8_9BACI|nr:HNH endonuclease [Falsibacillus albus]RLQ97247.1 HNH endonuclease [Falsibacillus albus]
MGKSSVKGKCELCLREEVAVTEHHLTPKEMGGAFLPTAMLCIPCHKQIHALFTNEELAETMNSVEKLRANPQLWKFIKWIKKQPASRIPKMKKSNHRKRKN